MRPRTEPTPLTTINLILQMPSDIPRVRAAGGSRLALINHPGARDRTSNIDVKNMIDVPIHHGGGRQVTKNRPTTRSSTATLPTTDSSDAPKYRNSTTPDAQQVIDTNGSLYYGPGLSESPSYAIDFEVAASVPPSPPLPLPDLEIVFNSETRTANVDDEVAYFNSIYPPSLEIFLVMLQLRHEMLEEEDIGGVYVGGVDEQLKLFGSLLGRAEAWDVIMDIMFKTAISVKVYVEARNPTKTYCTYITRNIS